MAQLPTAQAKAHQDTGDITVLIAPSPQAMMFYMDTTQAPFNDVNVRQAIKLIADRQALVASAINGFGTVGNDIVGKGLPFYDNDLPQRVAGHRPGQEPAQEGRPGEPDRAPAHVADLPRLRRGGDAARASRPRRPASRSS